MDPEASMENLRNGVLLTASMSEKSLSEFLALFSVFTLQHGAFFLRAGEYPLYLAFIEKGIVYAHYTDIHGGKIVKGIFTPGMFVLPMPSFIFRNPSFLSFQGVNETIGFRAKYSDLQMLSKKDGTVQSFLRLLIDREWIVNRELHDAGLYVYNYQSRFGLFREKYKDTVHLIPDEIIASYLNIPLKQLEKLLAKIKD